MDVFLSATQIILISFALFILSAYLTWLVKHYAIRKNILDIPNERSSHQLPTPRVGGIAIILTFTLALLGLHLGSYIESNLFLAIIGGGSAVALIGYYDDVYKIKVYWRITAHFLAAIWAIYWLGGFITLDLGTWKFTLNEKGVLLAIVDIVWFINLYNFMDGIDGLAGSEGLFVSLASSIGLCLLYHHAIAITLLFLSAAIAGFTLWNWSPAKIFLGDVGSGYLGYVFGVFSLYTVNQGSLPIVFWLIVLAIFLCDATFTLLYRLLQGKRWYVAHREHAYQYLISYGASHQQVSVGIVMINLFILLPLALVTLYMQKHACWFLISVIIGLFMVWLAISLRKFSFLLNNHAYGK